MIPVLDFSKMQISKRLSFIVMTWSFINIQFLIFCVFHKLPKEMTYKSIKFLLHDVAFINRPFQVNASNFELLSKFFLTLTSKDLIFTLRVLLKFS